jgi:hypothetical protein
MQLPSEISPGRLFLFNITVSHEDYDNGIEITIQTQAIERRNIRSKTRTGPALRDGPIDTSLEPESPEIILVQ